ncbi:N-acetylglucosamine kinase [Dyadobacter tibetensis]|uniref:N-acetylglucosamine kinase n=1 Tax=Dyadobacter tibetensis TaxID=1211851 RepID=UPI0004B81A8A|nr:N-acetylglucosamine kinase [Dyadobacter tibetensis]
MSSKTTNILIADSGSTKTDWVRVSEASVREQFQSTGMNPFYQNQDEIIEILKAEVLPNLPEPIDSVYFYGAGCADELSSKPISESLKSVFPDLGHLLVASDMLGAARGLCGHKPGLACILGTGANNALYDGAHITRSIGSLGFWLGDEGSGSYLGKTLLVAYLQGELPEVIQEDFKANFPDINRLSVLDRAYRQPFPNRYFAGFTKFIARHTHHPFIQEMVGEAFASFITKYIRKHPESAHLPVSFTGSIAYYFRDILEKQVDRQGLRIGVIAKAPLQGLVDYHLVG